MPTRADLEQFDRETSDLRTLMVAALLEFWSSHVVKSPADALGELRNFVLSIVDQYGNAASAVAVDFYGAARPDGAPAFTPTPVVRDDLVSPGTLNWATSPLLTDEWQKSLDRIAAETQKDLMAAVHESLGEATTLDPLDVKYARWPKNPDPCSYCVLRASRGAVYWSETTAERGDHIKCGCLVTPVFPGEQLPYLRKPYMAQYAAGASEAEGDILSASDRKARTKALLAGMRRANGTR